MRCPPTKRDRQSVQIDVSNLNLHRGEIVTHEYERIAVIKQEPAEHDERPLLAVPITYMTTSELEKVSRFPQSTLTERLYLNRTAVPGHSIFGDET